MGYSKDQDKSTTIVRLISIFLNFIIKYLMINFLKEILKVIIRKADENMFKKFSQKHKPKNVNFWPKNTMSLLHNDK